MVVVHGCYIEPHGCKSSPPSRPTARCQMPSTRIDYATGRSRSPYGPARPRADTTEVVAASDTATAALHRFILGEKVSVKRTSGEWVDAHIVKLTNEAITVQIGPRAFKNILRRDAELYIARPQAGCFSWLAAQRADDERTYHTGPAIPQNLRDNRHELQATTHEMLQRDLRRIQYRLPSRRCDTFDEQVEHAKYVVDTRPYKEETYYIGATCRSPEIRWHQETDVPHYATYQCMLVVWKGTGAGGSAVEVALIDHFLGVCRDRLVRNEKRGGGGISKGALTCWVYVCVGGGRPNPNKALESGFCLQGL